MRETCRGARAGARRPAPGPRRARAWHHRRWHRHGANSGRGDARTDVQAQRPVTDAPGTRATTRRSVATSRPRSARWSRGSAASWAAWAEAASSRPCVAGDGRAQRGLQTGVDAAGLAALRERVVAVEGDRQRQEREQGEPEEELELEAAHQLVLKFSAAAADTCIQQSLSEGTGGIMRLSWAHAAAGALTAVVAAGLLAMPSRLLGPDQARLTPISLPRAASTTVVVAARPVVKPHAKVVRRAAQPAPTAQLASVIVHPTVPTRTAPVAHKAVRHSAHRVAAARVTILNRVRRHPLPVDEPRVVAKPAPAPGAGACPCARSRSAARARTGPDTAGGDTRRRSRSGSGACPGTRPRADLADAGLRLHLEHHHPDDLAGRSELPARRSPRTATATATTAAMATTATTATTTGTTAVTVATATSTGTATATRSRNCRPRP